MSNLLVTVSSRQTLSNGSSFYGAAVPDTVRVVSGGTTVGFNLGYSGTEFVESGGAALGTVLTDGFLVVAPGGTASGTQFAFGSARYGAVASSGVLLFGPQDVLISSGGSTVSGETVGSGGLELVLPQGESLSAVVSGHGVQRVLSGGIASGATLGPLVTTPGAAVGIGGDQVVFFGGSAVATQVSGGTQEVLSAGVASGTILGSGGQETVSSGGTAVATSIGADGEASVLSAGTAFGTVVSSGGLLIVSSGGVATGTDVQSGGTLLVLPGGAAPNTQAESGSLVVSTGVLQLSGTRPVFVGSVESGGSVDSKTVQYSLAGGSALATTLAAGQQSPPNGDELVFSGGYASGTLLSGGEIQFVYTGGLASATKVVRATAEAIGGTLVGAIDSGGLVEISAGGVGVGTRLVSSGSQEDVYAGGTASATIADGGRDNIAGGMAVGTIVQNNGLQVVLDGGTATSTVLSTGGQQSVLPNSLISGTSAGAGTIVFDPDGTASGTVIGSGAFMEVSAVTVAGLSGRVSVSAGSAAATVVQSGGLAFFEPGSVATNTDVQSGGTLVVFPGASATGTIAEPGSTVLSTGVIVTSRTGGFQAIVSASADTVSGAILGPNVTEDVFPGGTAQATIVSGGSLQVFNGGVAVGASVQSDQGATVFSGGLASGTIVLGTNVISAGGTESAATVSGTERVVSGGMAIGSVIVAGGSQTVFEGTAIGTVVSAGGTQTIYGVSSTSGVASGTILSSGGVEVISSGGTATGTIIQPGGMIDLNALPYSSGGTAAVDANDLLTVSAGGQVYTQQLAGNYAGTVFSVTSDTKPDFFNGPGTLVTNDGVPCYLRGTRITTGNGEVPVEELAVGDLVATAGGTLHFVRLGTRAYDNRFVRDDPAVMPIRFATGSLGDGLPRRPLLVSPEHAMVLDGVLVPAKLLVDDEAIVQATGLSTIEYFHIELDSHDVLLAEGAPSESFVDCDSRAMFQNAATFAGEAPRWSFCAPRVEGGPALARIRTRLRRCDPVPAPSSVRGHLDYATHESCAGWACLPTDLQATLEVEVLVNGGVIGRVTANAWRPDVRAHGIGTGRYGFVFDFAQPLPRFRAHTITARAVGGAALAGTIQLEAATELDPASLPSLATALQARAATPEGARDVTGFLLEQLRACRPSPRRGGAPVALVLDDATPRLGRDAASAAITSHMQALQRLGYEVVFVPLDRQPGVVPDGVECAAWPDYPSVEDALRRHCEAALVYVHRVAGMSLYGKLIRTICPGARLVYAVADLHFVRLGRQAALEGNAALMANSHAMREQELAAIRQADMTLTHSDAEAGLLRRLVPGAPVGIAPWHVTLGPVPNSWRRRSGLVFVGGMAHAPNLDAVRWLASEIMPRLAALNPRIRCKVVGAGLTAADRAWLHPAMDVLGPVDDMSRVYQAARVAVAPLRFGAGIKGKVLEAFAAGLPCVMTPVAAEGYTLPETLHALVEADAEAFARRVAALHADPAANRAAGDAARGFVAETASVKAVDEAVQRAVASARAPKLDTSINLAFDAGF